MAAVNGLDGLSIGALAKRSGLSKSGLFGHFGSKQALQHAVLESVVEHFTLHVIAPALKEPTGLERLRTLFKRWLDWAVTDEWAGGCPLLAASFELDDRPGPLRDFLVDRQSAWLDAIARMARRAVADGAFGSDLDADEFAHEFQSIGLGFSYAARLLQDPRARRHAESAFERLIQRALA